MHRTRTAGSPANVVDLALTDELLVGGHRWIDAPNEQEMASRIIRRSSGCAELAQRGCNDADQAVRLLSDAMLAGEPDRSAALQLAHAWLGRHIPSGSTDGQALEDAHRWCQRVVGPDGSDSDRRWLAWGVALAVAELSARLLPWGMAAAAMLELLVAEGYDPAPWELRELRRWRLP